MSNIMELAKQAGAVSYTNRHYPDRPYRTFGPEELQKFYTLARADLEAEVGLLFKALEQESLARENCMRMRSDLKAENTKLRNIIERLLPLAEESLVRPNLDENIIEARAALEKRNAE